LTQNFSFQSNLTDTCGKFVLYFVFERFYNQDIDFQNLLDEIFDKNIEANELKVNKFYEELLK